MERVFNGPAGDASGELVIQIGVNQRRHTFRASTPEVPGKRSPTPSCALSQTPLASARQVSKPHSQYYAYSHTTP